MRFETENQAWHAVLTYDSSQPSEAFDEAVEALVSFAHAFDEQASWNFAEVMVRTIAAWVRRRGEQADDELRQAMLGLATCVRETCYQAITWRADVDYAPRLVHGKRT